MGEGRKGGEQPTVGLQRMADENKSEIGEKREKRRVERGKGTGRGGGQALYHYQSPTDQICAPPLSARPPWD